jgi:hypothetical protein
MTRQQPTNLEDVLRALYAAERNVRIQSFWDCGWRVRVGDEMNGFSAERTFGPDAFDQIAGWLHLQIADHKSPVAAHEPERVAQFARSLGFKIDRKT